MADFDTEATITFRADRGSLRDVRREAEQELEPVGSLSLSADGGTASGGVAAGGQPGQLRTIAGHTRTLQNLADNRNAILRNILDELQEGGPGGNGGDFDFRRPRLPNLGNLGSIGIAASALVGTAATVGAGALIASQADITPSDVIDTAADVAVGSLIGDPADIDVSDLAATAEITAEQTLRHVFGPAGAVTASAIIDHVFPENVTGGAPDSLSVTEGQRQGARSRDAMFSRDPAAGSDPSGGGSGVPPEAFIAGGGLAGVFAAIAAKKAVDAGIGVGGGGFTGGVGGSGVGFPSLPALITDRLLGPDDVEQFIEERAGGGGGDVPTGTGATTATLGGGDTPLRVPVTVTNEVILDATQLDDVRRQLERELSPQIADDVLRQVERELPNLP